MAKNKISEWSSTASNNTDVGGIDIAEGCAPSGINNGIREMMAQIKDMQSGADGDNFTVGGNLSVTGTTTLTGDATAPTQLSSDNSTKIATTAYVQAKVGTLGTMSTQNANAVSITGGTITGLSSALPTASGGTGTTTSTGTGNVVLSNSPTLVSPALGTPSSIDLTNATGTANSLNAGIGVNQTWQNVTSSRVAGNPGTTYTNNTGKPIQVMLYQSGGSAADYILYINGTFFCRSSNANGYQIIPMFAIIPNGSTYRVDTTYSTMTWWELR